MHGFKLSSVVLKMSAADFILCGSVADLDTVRCHIPSSKQLTNATVVVRVMAAVGGGRLNCGCTLPQFRKWKKNVVCICAEAAQRLLFLLWICMFVSMLSCTRVCVHA